MGSGTTAVICRETNRQYLGYEIDNEYYNICKRRMKEHIPLKEVSIDTQNPLLDALT